jgi:hypothetical protein
VAKTLANRPDLAASAALPSEAREIARRIAQETEGVGHGCDTGDRG